MLTIWPNSLIKCMELCNGLPFHTLFCVRTWRLEVYKKESKSLHSVVFVRFDISVRSAFFHYKYAIDDAVPLCDIKAGAM